MCFVGTELFGKKYLYLIAFPSASKSVQMKLSIQLYVKNDAFILLAFNTIVIR